MALALAALLALVVELVRPSWEVEGPNLAPNLNVEQGVRGFCNGTSLRHDTHKSQSAHQFEQGYGLLQLD